MHIRKLYILLIFLLCAIVVHGQESRTEICIDFRVNKIHVDASFADNAVRMQEIITFLQEIRRDSTIQIMEVSFCGAASPEGSDQLNRKLAQGRLSALEKLVRQEVEIPDSIITRNDSYIPWNYLKSQIEDSELALKEEVLAILNEEVRLVDYHHPNTRIDNRIVKLKQLDGGKVWQQINELFFSRMRNACTVLVTYREEPQPAQEPEITPEPVVVVEPQPVVAELESIVEVVKQTPDTIIVKAEPVAPVVPKAQDWTRQLHLKTNMLGLGMAIANVAVEVDICKHLSFTLPVYYSAWDYFKSTIKFRTLAVQPEFRYWFKTENEGWFLGAHYGLAYYNLAFGEDYRYQDHNRETPTMGGGVAIGYRAHLSNNKRWKLEFAVGGGVYPLRYDKFRNTPDTRKGLMITSDIHKTYWGIDQAAMSLTYTFDLKKKGGKP